MIVAPASSAASATFAFTVSMAMGTAGEFFADCLDHRRDAANFFFGADRFGAGARAFAADIENIGTFLDHARGIIDGSSDIILLRQHPIARK